MNGRYSGRNQRKRPSDLPRMLLAGAVHCWKQTASGALILISGEIDCCVASSSQHLAMYAFVSPPGGRGECLCADPAAVHLSQPPGSSRACRSPEHLPDQPNAQRPQPGRLCERTGSPSLIAYGVELSFFAPPAPFHSTRNRFFHPKTVKMLLLPVFHAFIIVLISAHPPTCTHFLTMSRALSSSSANCGVNFGVHHS